MKILVLTIHSDDTKQKTKPLRESCLYHGFEFQELIYGFTFGQQYHLIAEWIRTYQGECTHILYTDAWDTLCFGSHKETCDNFIELKCKMLISGEKGCFPHVEGIHTPDMYPETNTPWKYVNGGGCLFEIEYFKELTSARPFGTYYIDPHYLFGCFNSDRDNIKIDNDCNIFQTLAHSIYPPEKESEWELINNSH